MNLAVFQQTLREKALYETPEGPQPPAAFRWLGRWDWWYYLTLLRIVCAGARLARQGRFDNQVWAECSWRTLRIAEWCGARARIEAHPDFLVHRRPVVYVANHMSMLETFVLPSVLLTFGPLTVVLKQSLTRYPLFGVILRALEPIGVSRRQAREDFRTVMQRGPAALSRGVSVLLFPQATRSVAFNPADFNSLGVKLAARAGVALVPLALKTDFQGIGRLVRDIGRLDRRQPVRIAIGPPLPVSGSGRAQHEAALRFITARLRGWGVPVLEASKPSLSAPDVL